MSGVPYNRTQIISNALILAGKTGVTAIEQSPVAIDMNQIYDQLMSGELSNPDWRFATTVKQLSQLAGVDPNYKGYTAAFQKPAGLLAIWQIWPQLPYEVFGTRIWTRGGNNSTIQVEYRELKAEGNMPPAFINYFVWLMAYTIGIGVTENDKILSRLEKGKDKAHAVAMTVNSQEAPNKGIQSSPWVANRYNGDTGWGGRGGL